MQKVYMCIDLKTFFASVECVERNLDPFTTNLVVADPSRGKGALCLAISPKMKSLGVKNRCRLMEIPENIEYMIALPRMHLYLEYSADIYAIYLKYCAKQDIYMYSIDEGFLDMTPYLQLYKKTPKEMAQIILDDVMKNTGITATVGIGTNMFLAKVAMDIVAKKVDSHIAILDEERFRKYMWHHKPITDFWQIGSGTARRLLKYGIVDMAGIAKCPEDILYKEFGITAEYLIDHAWGRESTTIKDVHSYQPVCNSISHSQVLFEDYAYDDALLVVKEMVELKCLDLAKKHLVSDSISLYIGYSKDTYPPTGGSTKISTRTNSYRILLKEFIELYKRTTNKEHKIRRIAICFGNTVDEFYETYDIFSDIDDLEKERKLQMSLVAIRSKYGKSAVLKGMNLLDKATTPKRNKLIGGHNA